MPRTHGYSAKGRRCFGIHDWQARGRTNVIGALLGASLLTITLFECNIDSDVFNSWVATDLIPKLPPNTVVVMDNAAFHKRKDTRETIQNAGHILEYLPTYSPDLNPIEPKWAQAKPIRRREQCEIGEIFKNHSI